MIYNWPQDEDWKHNPVQCQEETLEEDQAEAVDPTFALDADADWRLLNILAHYYSCRVVSFRYFADWNKYLVSVLFLYIFRPWGHCIRLELNTEFWILGGHVPAIGNQRIENCISWFSPVLLLVLVG